MVIAGGGLFYFSRGLDAISNLKINEINILSLQDGVYNGIYEAGRWTNQVNVTIRGHKIIDIDVVKDVRFPNTEVTEELINQVIEKQYITLDTISGATVTCKAYLKSIENALTM